jgi:hypothetical protein
MSPALFVYNYTFKMGTASLSYCVRSYVKRSSQNVVEFIVLAHYEGSSVQLCLI